MEFWDFNGFIMTLSFRFSRLRKNLHAIIFMAVLSSSVIPTQANADLLDTLMQSFINDLIKEGIKVINEAVVGSIKDTTTDTQSPTGIREYPNSILCMGGMRIGKEPAGSDYGHRGNSGYPENEIVNLYRLPCYKGGTGEIAGIQPPPDMECDPCNENGSLESVVMKATYVVIQPVLRSLRHTTEEGDDSYGFNKFGEKEFYSHTGGTGLLAVSIQGIDGWRKYAFPRAKTEATNPKYGFAEGLHKGSLTTWGALEKQSLIFPVGDLKKCQEELSK